MAKTKKQAWVTPQESEFSSPAEEYIYSILPISFNTIADKWQVPVRTIENWGKKDQWVKKREAYQAQLAELVKQKHLENAATRVDTLYASLKNIYSAQITAITDKLLAEGGKVHKDLSVFDLNFISLISARTAKWGLLLEGVNIEKGDSNANDSEDINPYDEWQEEHEGQTA